jgi:glucose-6-phosphate isomerase
MSSAWQWQQDAAWQSCSAVAKAHAETMGAKAPEYYADLQTLVAQQPLVGDAATVAALCHAQVQRFRSQQAERLVVIGTGGASLGAQALCALAKDPTQVRFLENCDPATLEQFFLFPKERTVWMIVSKSGETVETLAAALALIGHYAETDLTSRVAVVTQPGDSSLQRLAAQQQWTVIDHPMELGGRYSVFSVVGLIPAAFAGLPIEEMLQAAETMLQQLLQQNDPNLLPHAAWFAANLHEKPMHVLMAYADRLRPATQWYKQLWAESLGKDGKGATPITAIGAIDQHSQLQLYLDGPRDKLLTLWLPYMRGIGHTFPEIAVEGLAFLKGRHMGEVMHATAEATAQTLAKAGVPLRVVRGTLTPQSMAQWMVRQMLETLLVAHLIGVDPYSQPAVEAGKELTRQSLKRGA